MTFEESMHRRDSTGRFATKVGSEQPGSLDESEDGQSLSARTQGDELPDGVVSRTVNKTGVIHFLDAEGRLHNPDGPAVIYPDKATFWLVTGQEPRRNWDGWFETKEWCNHGQLHRIDGPAVVNGDGTVEYFVDGEELTAEEFSQHYPAIRTNQAREIRA